MVGGMGIGLWLLWNRVIFGNWVYFGSSQYSAQTQQQLYIQTHVDLMYHNLPLSARNVVILAAETVGPVLLGVLVLAILLCVLRASLSPSLLAASAFLVPVGFYVVSYYSGQGVMFAPGAASAAIHVPWFNTRYGISIVPPLVVFLATLVARWRLGQIGLTLLIALQSLVVAHGGIVSLQDGQFGASCFATTTIPAYLAQHYDGGYILDDTYHTDEDYAAAGIHLSQVVYQGSGSLWQAALADPGAHVAWVVVLPGDLVAQHVDITSPTFQSQFTLLLQDPISGVYLFRGSDLPPLPTRTLPPELTRNDHALCHP
jgi:hypothetical protein